MLSSIRIAAFFVVAIAATCAATAAAIPKAASPYEPLNRFATLTIVVDGPGGGGGGSLTLAQFAESAVQPLHRNAQLITPAPGPAIGQSAIGSPTYVVPPATKAGGFINIGQAFNDAIGPYVDAALQALIALLVAWVLRQIQIKTGVQVEDSRRDALTRFLQNQAASLIADGHVKVAGLKIQVSDDALAASANQALARIPDAMKAFNLSPEAIEKKIVDAIPQTQAGAQIVAQAHAAPAPALVPKPAAAPAAPAAASKP